MTNWRIIRKRYCIVSVSFYKLAMHQEKINNGIGVVIFFLDAFLFFLYESFIDQSINKIKKLNRECCKVAYLHVDFILFYFYFLWDMFGVRHPKLRLKYLNSPYEEHAGLLLRFDEEKYDYANLQPRGTNSPSPSETCDFSVEIWPNRMPQDIYLRPEMSWTRVCSVARVCFVATLGDISRCHCHRACVYVLQSSPRVRYELRSSTSLNVHRRHFHGNLFWI